MVESEEIATKGESVDVDVATERIAAAKTADVGYRGRCGWGLGFIVLGDEFRIATVVIIGSIGVFSDLNAGVTTCHRRSAVVDSAIGS